MVVNKKGQALAPDKPSSQSPDSAPDAVSEDTARPPASRRKRTAKSPDSHVATALRSAYQETVREAVPDEFMDLLGKLS